jgi:hypothetical protein
MWNPNDARRRMTMTGLLQQVTQQLSCEHSGLLSCFNRVSDSRSVEDLSCLRGFLGSDCPQSLNGKGAHCVATLSINNVAAKRNRREDLDAEHKTGGNSALRKSIAGLVVTTAVSSLLSAVVWRAGCYSLSLCCSQQRACWLYFLVRMACALLCEVQIRIASVYL